MSFIRRIFDIEIKTTAKMKLFKYSELANVQIDENFDNDNFSDAVDNALCRGFNPEFPIVIDEDGIVIDGNHRFIAFQAEGRLDEVVFCKVIWNDFLQLKNRMVEEGTERMFNRDDEFFYSQIQKIAA